MEIPKRRGNTPFDVPPGFHDHRVSSDVSLFSTSLPVLRHPNSSYTDASQGGVEDTSTSVNVLNQDAEVKAVHDDLDLHVVGSMLPDDEDLLAGITDGFDLSAVQNQLDYLEDDDVFGSGGGLEMDSDPTEGFMVSMARTGMTDGYIGNGVAYGLQNGVGAVAGEHPYGEHPSRTLFVRNINSNVEDSELRSLFEQYGDIRTIYTPCKHRGFVMISYYDIRDARTAMRSLQNKPLRRRKLDIHFSIPKENPSDKDMNQGTLVVFNLDASVSNDDLHQIFGAYGEVKEIRETPNKRHHKFIEFYDVRAAEAALKALNRSDIAGKRIKLEPSRPGGARRNLMNQLGHELEQDEHRSIRHLVGSPLSGSPPGLWGQFGSPADTSQLHGLSQSPTLGSSLPGLASILPPLSNSIKIPPIGKDNGKIAYADRARSGLSSTSGHFFQHSHSLPDQSTGLFCNMKNSPGSLASFGYETSTTAASAVGTLTGPQFLWGSPNLYSEQSRPPAWHRASSGHSLTSSRQGQGFPYSSHHNSFSTPSGSYFRHYVGSAPSVVPLERHFSHFSESPETSFMNHGAFAGVGFNGNDGSLIMNMNGRSVPISAGFSANMPENNSYGFRMTPPQRIGHLLNGGVTYSGLGSSGIEGFMERGRNRLAENNGGQIENKQQYQLQLDKIVSGEDTRTTLMIKNIPNKYTSKMLLAAIDENHRGTYDFVYLPIDFKNKCNVGYAFINMSSPTHIIPFCEDFNGKKWEKFNSEKVASLAYARIQGRPALVSHFENSSLMNEDKRCRPILFQAEVPVAAVKVPSSISNGNVQVREKDEIAQDSAGILSVNTSMGAEMVDGSRSSNGYR